MPKKRKENIYKKYNDDDFKQAVEGITSGRLSQRKAASVYGIPQATLSDHLRGKVKDGVPPGRKPLIPLPIEQEIAKKCALAAEMGLGMSKNQVMEKVGKLVKEINPGKYTAMRTKPGKDWWYGFKLRNPGVTLRAPEKLTSTRSKGLNSVKVGEYFSDLKEEIGRLGLEEKPQFIWNMDEKGLPLEHTPSKVVAAKGSRTVPGRVSDTKERNTIIASINGIGQAMPPLIIVKGKTQKSVLSWNTVEAPTGSRWTYQEKAWTEDILGVEWFTKIFLQECGDHRPQLLVMDGHHSHEVLGLIEKARENDISLITLPPHTTHYLCPLDRTVFGPLSQNYNEICTEFCQNPANYVNKITWPGLFRKAYEKAFKVSSIIEGFRACGIHPWNPLRIPLAAFLPSAAYDTMGGAQKNLNEHPLQWVVTKCNTESTQPIRQNTSSHASLKEVGENLTKLTSESGAGPRYVAVDVTSPVASTSSEQENEAQNDNITLVAPPSPASVFNTSLSADVLMPVIDDETREAVECLISLDSACTSPEVLCELSLDTSGYTKCIDLPLQLSESNLLPSGSASSETSADWNETVNSIFSVDPPPAKKIKSKPAPGHRILTSDAVIAVKRKEEEAKKTKELNKQKRQKIKELINAKKLLESQIKAARADIST